MIVGDKMDIKILTDNNKTISVMESCTGGCLSNSITNIPGASIIFNFGAVTYSNQYKIKLGVNSELIDKYTVYSSEVAKDMARAIVEYTNSNYGIGVTGKLNVEDPNNPYGDNSTVYTCVYDKDNNMYYPKTIVLKSNDRITNKECIINEIKELLLSILK